MTIPNPATPPPPPRPRRLGRIVLFVSLAFNLLIVGLVAGAMLRGNHGHDRGRPEVLRALGFGPFVSALPRADRDALGEAIKREAGSFRENRKMLRGQFEALLAALRADPFDAEEALRLIDAQQSRIGERQAIGQRLLLERINAMSAAQRAEYADALDRALTRRRSWRD
ncbi:MAG: periplasmic heavy metal sensor [Rhodobacter sp.]|nr:periplasmic heavy metal sensor [Rhodobacter sp.]